MDIEKEVFKDLEIDFIKLKNYGFKKEDGYYVYCKNILDNSFKVCIQIYENKSIIGKVYDLNTNEEYTNIRLNTKTGSFINNVRKEYKNILLDIKDKCCNLFNNKQTNIILNYILTKYNDKPEFLWKKFDKYSVFRNKNNSRWYAIIMNIDKSKISDETGYAEIINIKLDPMKIEKLINKKGYYKAYHMNKKSWITIILDDTLSNKEVMNNIDESYKIVDLKK